MKKRLFCVITALSLAITAFSGVLSGCSGGEETAASVWGAYSTVKVTRNVKENAPYEKLSASVSVDMTKNETEGAQIILTAGEKDISGYDLVLSDLSDGNGNVIKKENISVYHQKYLEVKRESDTLNKNYVAGDFVPDMLLPLETAKAYGENKVNKGENQGITIEITTARDTVPATYTGSFKLVADNESFDIPVSVKVWDIEYEGRRSFQSSFLVYRNSLIAGEYEASDELVQRYVDFLLDYKMNVYVIKSSYTPEEFAKEAVRLFENDNYNSICIPKNMKANYSANGSMAKEIVEYIKAIATISTPEKPYIDYVYIYPAYFDEADQHSDVASEVEKVFKNGGEWDKTLEKAVNAVKKTAEYQAMDDDFKQRVEEAVLNIPAIFTNVTYREEWVENTRAVFCPYISLLGDGATSAKYTAGAEKNANGNLWAYTCVKPNYPNPTFHIDDFNLGSRVSGWMEKKYGVNGYLYWAVNMYEAINEDEWRFVDVYETAERAGYCGGDGFLLYPGAYYGSEYPFASVRLAAYRDSMDDYDTLCVYERAIERLAEKYGATLNANDFVSDLYDSLFAGTSYYADDALLFSAKTELYKRILAANSEDGLLVLRENDKIIIYSSGAAEVNGKTLVGAACGEGFKYELDANGEKLIIKTANGEYEYTFGAAEKLTDFGGGKGNFRTTEQSEAKITEGAAELKIVSVYRSDDESIDGATKRFSPYAQIAVQGLSGAKALEFTVRNLGDTNAEFTVRIIGASGAATTLDGVFVPAGESKKVHIAIDGASITEELLSGVTAIRFAFSNVNSAGDALMPERNIAIGEIYRVK